MTDHPEYKRAYARHAEPMRAKWRHRTVAEARYARDDILATMAHADYDPAYAGKLYAELDAVREVLDRATVTTRS